MNNTYLAHYGVLGMKWGVRRYQPYGEGGYNPKKKRRGKTQKTHAELMKSTNAKELYKNRDKLSDKELQDRINRIQKENQLHDLQKTSSQGFIQSTLASSGSKVIGAVITGVMFTAGKKAVVALTAGAAGEVVASELASNIFLKKK